MKYELAEHARTVLSERKISMDWMERALERPLLVMADPTDPTLERRYCKISENGNRVLRVVVNNTVAPIRVVSVYFDRTMKGKL